MEMLLSTQNSTSGGSSDTEVNELAVSPCDSPSRLRIVTIATPVAKRPQAIRNSLASTLIAKAYKSASSARPTACPGLEVEDLRRQPEPALKPLHQSLRHQHPEPERLQVGLDGDVLLVDDQRVDQAFV